MKKSYMARGEVGERGRGARKGSNGVERERGMELGRARKGGGKGR